MMHIRKSFLFSALLLVFVAGCGTDHTVYLEQTTVVTEQTEEDGADAGSGGMENAGSGSAQDAESGSAQDAESSSAQDVDIAGMQAENEVREECCVYVCGAVQTPGVYVLNAGARIYEAIEMAGGLTENAGVTAVNQAQEICDGQMIYIPTKEEAAAYPVSSSAVDGTAQQSSQTVDEDDGRVDLNTASAAELMTLSGIGETKAAAILAYREAHGGFSSIEEIMNVDGIKEGSYNRIKDNIKVK